MGFGQIVTLRLPSSRLAEVNVELERSAWGVFRTGVPGYDFVPVRERIKERVRQRQVMSHAAISIRTRRATASRTYQNLLGDALERAFAMGIHDLPGLVGRLGRRVCASPTARAGRPSCFKKR